MTEDTTFETEQIELPDYNGQTPVGMKTKLSGTANRILRPHALRERSVLVLEVSCSDSGHGVTDDGIHYHETHRVLDLFEIEGDGGAALIRFLRSSHQAARDLAEGRVQIPELETEGYVDAGGTVLTPAEVAERRGDPLAFLKAQKRVIVFDDHSRGIWPDEFAEGTPWPTLGAKIDKKVVADVLDPDTGESRYEGSSLDRPGLPDADEAGDDELDDGSLPDLEPDETEGDDPTLPTTADFEFVDRKVTDLRDALRHVPAVADLRRLRRAEEQGRGHGHTPRKSALVAIDNAIAALEAKEATT